MFDKLRDIIKKSACITQPVTENKDCYYDNLLQKYGKCKTLDKHITLLLIADLHGGSIWKDITPELEGEYDACIILGDLYSGDYQIITNNVKKPIYGIYGNHDAENALEKYGIININHGIVTINGIRFTGFEGCPRYKENMIGYTQEESIKIGESTPAADIVISHASPYRPGKNDPVHCGFKGVSEYIYRNQIPYCFYGHNHEPQKETMSNGCIAECIYGVKIIQI